MSDQPDDALRDALYAQCLIPECPTALYMQSVALSRLNMQSEATDALNEASQLEIKRIQKSEEEEMKRQKTSSHAPQAEEKGHSDGGETFSFPTPLVNP
jgi:hypothetical protein